MKLSLRALEVVARARLEPRIFDFFAGGADDEETLRTNEDAFGRLGLVPRVLRAVRPEIFQDLLGVPLRTPVVIAPTAFHRLAHPEGELATARAAASAGALYIVSMAATTSVEAIAAAGSLTWFQLYIQPDLGFTEAVLRRAEAAGCRGVVVSVDSPVFGHRERDVRNNFFDLPGGLVCENMRDPDDPEKVRSIQFDPDLTWEHIDWLRSQTSLPVILKGIAHPDDAELAIAHGAEAIIVSNHGGRQLDTQPAAIKLLPPITEVVAGRVPILLDGGVRRGTDVLKAMALGATAVGIGRPVLWGLAVDGEAGVRDVLEVVTAELVRALTLCGCRTPADATLAATC
ncbi:MAG TPA: alpha-hydroxy acid oxidase [Candidatus Limnocylindrales bacterium]|nr:alpha-hydroxy acid oxidase [Candidatus Limnocylindrales bacterium]